MDDNGNGVLEFNPKTYPQACGLCGHVSTAHTAKACRYCKAEHAHEYVRADVLACTLLSEMNQKLEIIGKLLYTQVQLLERAVPDPTKPRIVVPH